jgi:CRISPR/Cas system-associated protein Cas10 (large subunit of type III CRISPR-Cas system)
MSEELTDKLDKLANFLAQRDVFNLQKKELIDQVLTPETRARLDEIEAEFAGKMEAVEANIAVLEEEIRQEALRQGASVKGSFLRVIWHKGRVSWDTKSLDDYAKSHPEVIAFRKQGEPYVSIVKV